MSEEQLAYDNHILQRELDRRGDPSLNPCERQDHELAELEGRLARIGKGCMLAIDCIESVSYWNGMKQVNAYEAFDRYWLTNLQAEDMTYLRGLMGIPEPGTPEGKAWMEANKR